MKDFAATFVVSSHSSERLRAARQLVTERGYLDRVEVDVATAGERKKVEHYRVGDYFSSIHIVDCGPTSFRIVFVPQPAAKGYWKDLAVRILISVKESGVTVRSDRKR